MQVVEEELIQDGKRCMCVRMDGKGKEGRKTGREGKAREGECGIGRVEWIMRRTGRQDERWPPFRFSL
jgi:hypothetical protein